MPAITRTSRAISSPRARFQTWCGVGAVEVGRGGGRGHPAAPRGAPESTGLASSSSVSRVRRARYAGWPAVRPPYVTSSNSRAAERSRVAWSGRTRPASAAASSAVRPGRGRAGRVPPGTGRWPACVPGRPRSSGGRRRVLRPRPCAGRRCGAVALEEGVRGGAGGALRGAEPPPERGAEADDQQGQDDEPRRAAGGGARGGVEHPGDPVPEVVQGALEEARIVLVVHRLGQFGLGRLPGRDPWSVHGYVARADDLPCCCGAPRPRHPISSEGCRCRGPGAPRPGPGRGRAPRGGCAGRRRAGPSLLRRRGRAAWR